MVTTRAGQQDFILLHFGFFFFVYRDIPRNNNNWKGKQQSFWFICDNIPSVQLSLLTNSSGFSKRRICFCLWRLLLTSQRKTMSHTTEKSAKMLGNMLFWKPHASNNKVYSAFNTIFAFLSGFPELSDDRARIRLKSCTASSPSFFLFQGKGLSWAHLQGILSLWWWPLLMKCNHIINGKIGQSRVAISLNNDKQD